MCPLGQPKGTLEPPKGTVPFGGSNVPFGSTPRPTMCPLAPPLDQRIFNSYLNYLSLKVSVVKVKLALGGILIVVHMKQTFGTDNYHFQYEGCGREILFVPFGL